jgi:deoxyribodipyrimidine photo-lyase
MVKHAAEEHPELKHPSTKRAKQIDAETPFHTLIGALGSQDSIDNVENVIHWFRSKDLRIQDNKALHNASSFAKEQSKPLICAYIYCPEEFEWHGTSPARSDLIVQTLGLIQNELKDLNIPMMFVTANARKEIVPSIVDFVKANNGSHVFANFEYEVDEIRRDIEVLKQLGNDAVVSLYHDQTVMEPESIRTGNDKPMKVFTPYHKTWLGLVKDDPSLLDTHPLPSKHAKSPDVKSGSHDVPPVPESQKFDSDKTKQRIRKLWPAGHAAGMQRLRHFINDKIENYAATRSDPSKDSSSRMSAYFSSGTVSVREALTELRKYNDNSADFSSNGASPGVAAWVREICFRELYRQMMVVIPHNSMNLPQNLKFEFVQWEDDEEGWKRWYEGRTGVPFVDAGMRQLNHEAYMHNRARMNVSSYLYCNLLIDYRRGERYFAETLVDWDLCNNTQGWEPSYTVFNPVSQAEKNDPTGEYIRRWVPELKDVKGKAVYSPHDRLPKTEFEKLGYPRPHVDWHETKQRCMQRFKSDMADAQP